MILATGFSALSVLAASVTAEPPVRGHEIEPEDYFSIGVIAGCAASPDGNHVAYTELRWEPPAEDRNLDLWVLDRETKARRRLTFDPAADGSPSWSPDGRYVYFATSRTRAGEEKPPYNGKKQVWRIWPGSDEPFAVTRVEDGIGQYALSKDGRTLYYTISEEHVDDDFKDLRTKHKHLEYGHGITKISQVWKLDLESWRAEKLIDEKRVVRSFAVSDDEKRIAMITTPDDTMMTNEGWSRVDVWDADTKEVTVVTGDGWRADHPSPYGWVANPCWSADGMALAFDLSFDGYPTELYVAEWGLKGDSRPGESTGDSPSGVGSPPGVSVRMLDRPDEVDADGHLRWRGDSRELCFIGESHARKWVCGLRDVRDGGRGKFRKLTDGDIAVSSYSLDDAGESLFVVMDTPMQPPDVFHAAVGDTSAVLQRLTTVNPQVDTWKVPQMRVVKWQAPDGTEVEGILELPPDYKEGSGPLPMIVELHGGPTASSLYRMRFWIYGRTLMAAKGYALLTPNYRGSTGYGRKFMTGLIGHENDVEVNDVLAGVDAMIERGIADPDRLGVMGWSNGGFLVNGLITHTDRFKAASTGAGILDMVLQWASEDTPGHVVNYMHGLPWEVPDAYRKASAVFNLGKVTTPTIVHVGGDDPRCPPAHSRGLYRALRYYVKVPTELVVYPGEHHSPFKYKNRKAKMEWDLAWFDRHLLGKTGEEEKESETEKEMEMER